MAEIRLNARWTDDCQGKKDYDGEILSISTRYWPRGGGFTVIARDGVPIDPEENDARQEIKPSAHCDLSILTDGFDTICLAERKFEAETFEEIKVEVEEWAQQQMDKAVQALKAAFEDACFKPGFS